MSELSERIGRDCDKKNEIPKVKLDIPKIRNFEKGGYADSGIFLENNPFSEFERIANDIRDRVDNAMAMEFTRVIGELLKSNGVTPKITEVRTGGTFDKDRNVIEERYGVVIEDLDFTEHDKVFEDKIAELKKDYKTASELLGKYQQENESLKKRIEELETENDKYVEMIKGITGNTYEEIKGNMKIHESGSSDCVKDLPFDPMETANYLINATREREANSLELFFGTSEKVNEDRYSVDDLEQIAEHLLVYCKHNKEVEE